MNIVDIVIVLFLLFGVVIGWKRGFTKQLIGSLGFILIVVISFLLKNPISIFFYEHFPFFKFTGILKGVTVLNIALYEILAFGVIFSLLLVVYKILLFTTSIFEKALKFTIILGIPSKILGAILGFFEYFIFTFIILYLLSFPGFSIGIFNQSKLKDPILTKTPFLAQTVKNSMNVIQDFESLKEKYETVNNPREFNRETLDLFLQYKIVTVDSIDYLIDHQKIDINKQDSILEKYRNEGE